MLRIYYEILSVIRETAPVVRVIRRCDPDLANQLNRALTSVALNVAEGSGSQGRNRRARYFNALGSHRETRACFDVAVAKAYVAPMSHALERKLDSIAAVLWKVSH